MAVGVWSNHDAIADHWQVNRRFEPKMSRDQATAIRARWNDAVQRSQGWAKED
jgi:glycerol kinase